MFSFKLKVVIQEENKARATHRTFTIWNEHRFPVSRMEQGIAAEV